MMTQIPKIYFLLFVTTLLVVEILTTSRELRVNINPGCYIDGHNCTTWTNTSLIHIRADGSNDSIHFIWSFIGSPSLLLARTPPESTLNVNWTAFANREFNSISFDSAQPIYTFGYALSKVWIYNDTNDNVRIDRVNQSQVTGYNAEFFVWERQDYLTVLNSTDVELKFISRQYLNHSLGPAGFFSFSVRAKEIDGYSEILPYMLHNSNMSQIDIDFSNVQLGYPTENPKNARVAFEFVVVQGDEESVRDNSTKMRFERVETLDDEHTPGVFSTINIRSPVHGEYDQSFLQWKPICYTQLIRDITNSIDVNSYGIRDNSIDFESGAVNGTILWAYYGAHLDSVVMQSFNVSFGTKKDGFYNSTPHISWTHMTGFGTPPEDYVSLLVILVVSIGFGIPATIIVISSIFIIYKRMSRPRDEVLLGH